MQDLLYSDTHEWVRVEDDGQTKIAVVGISAFAIEQLTDLVYIELSEVGRQVEAGSEFGEVESVKAVSPLYSPVTGEITAVNTDLTDKLETLSEDPYQAGWIIKIRITDASSLENLLDHAEYQKQCAAEQ